jgi:glutamine synthetase
MSEEERAARKIRRLPATLREALDHLEEDAVLTEALGPLLTRAFVAVKRLEWESFSKEDVAYEVKHHFWKF